MLDRENLRQEEPDREDRVKLTRGQHVMREETEED